MQQEAGTQPPDSLSDEALVAGCRDGDQAAWATLITRYQRLIYTVPVRLGLAEEDAVDVFQNTCMRLHEHLYSLRDPARVAAWLAITARRLSLDVLASRRPAAAEDLLATLPSPDPTADETLVRLEEQQRIRNAVQALPPRCRDLVYLLFYDPDQPSYAEVAARLGMPIGSIGPNRQRCFAQLRAKLRG
jgi:RNA polymerase sigma factor (sigma-70 family)